MLKNVFFLLLMAAGLSTSAQQVLTPETLWSLGRVGAVAQSPDGKELLYRVSTTDLSTEKSNTEYFLLHLNKKENLPTSLFRDKQFVQWDQNGLYALQDNQLLKSTDEGKTWITVSVQIAGADYVR